MTADAVQMAVMQCLDDLQVAPTVIRAVRRAFADANKSHTGGTLCAAHEPRTARVMAVLPSQPLPGPLAPRQLFQPVTAQAARLRKHGETQ